MIKDKRQKKLIQSLNRFWIIGFGRFGRIAVERIIAQKTDAAITIVDKRSVNSDHAGITAVRQDGIQWLAAKLTPESPIDIIVPAIPIHVTAEWIKNKLSKKNNILSFEIPEDWLARLPHGMAVGGGRVVVSHADFICPDNCPEPETICTHTGKPRPKDLFRLLDEIRFDAVLPIVLRSYQILPGVGGIYPRDLFHALTLVRNNRHRPLMIATACRCHGVIDFIRLQPKSVASV